VAWPIHKYLCAEDPLEIVVMRGGWLLRKLLLASRQRASYDWMRDWQWNPEYTCLSIRREKCPGDFIRFTPDVAVTEGEREMIWAARYCKAAVAYFSGFLKILLSGKAMV
jgi:hypothetical protein